MPIIKVLLLAGHEPGVKTRLANLLTDAYRTVIAAPPASITVTMQEIDSDNYMRGGAKRRRSDALPDPIKVINAYDKAFVKGDFDAVRAFVTDTMIYRLPGGVEVNDPEDAAAWLASGSTRLDITQRAVETAFGEHGPVVFMRCRMSGVRTNGEAYENVRVALRYEFAKDKIASVEIWSDLPPMADDAAAPPDGPPSTQG